MRCSFIQALAAAMQLLLVAAIVVMSLSPVARVVHAAPGPIIIGGSTTIQPAVTRIAREFMKDHPGSRIRVIGGGSGAGITALLHSELEIANSSRFISAQELGQAMSNGVYPVPFRIADDCIIPIIHKSNRVKNLALENLKRIYRGDLTNWKELGGADRPITVYSRVPDSGTFGVWRDIVMGGQDLAPGVITRKTSADVVKAVSANSSAIGYISLGHLSASIKPLRVEGVMGSLYSVRDGSYVLSRPLFMFTRGWPSGQLLEFINYALSPDKGQSIVRKLGFIPVYLPENY